MNGSDEENTVCGHCDCKIEADDDYCPNCGGIFIDDMVCQNHPTAEAEGVCIICQLPYCSRCAGWSNRFFLCVRHSSYEIYEGMVRVFGTSDENLAQYAHQALEQAGCHPFTYSRKTSPISIGGPSYTLFRVSGEYNGHLINEVRLMVPTDKLLKAEKILTDLGILSSDKSPGRKEGR